MDKKSEYIDSLEKYKEVARIQYDYFKHLSLLSTASIGAILAFISKTSSLTYVSILAGLSLICFFVSIVVSLSGMVSPANIIMYLTAIRTLDALEVQEEKQKAERRKLMTQLNTAVDNVQKANKCTKNAFLLGIILFLLYASINFVCVG